MLCGKCSGFGVTPDRGPCRNCSGMKTSSSAFMYCPDCSEELLRCEFCGESFDPDAAVEVQPAARVEDEDFEISGNYRMQYDNWFQYTLWFDTPKGWQGPPAGSFVLTEEYESGDSGGNTKEFSGSWKLVKGAQGGAHRIELTPETVEEAAWDLEMHGGEDQEMRYKYNGDSPLLVSVEEISEGQVKKLTMRAFEKQLELIKGDE